MSFLIHSFVYSFQRFLESIPTHLPSVCVYSFSFLFFDSIYGYILARRNETQAPPQVALFLLGGAVVSSRSCQVWRLWLWACCRCCVILLYERLEEGPRSSRNKICNCIYIRRVVSRISLEENKRNTNTPGRYIYRLGVGWLAIPGNLTIRFLLRQKKKKNYCV
jgi:hypothetical protein